MGAGSNPPSVTNKKILKDKTKMIPSNLVEVADLVAGPANAPVQLVGRLNIVGVADPEEVYAIVPPTVLNSRATVYNSGGYVLTITTPPNVEFIIDGSTSQQVLLAPGYAVELVCLDDQWLVFLSK